MNHRHSQLLASIAVAAAAAACSSEPANTLAGGSFDPVVGAQPTPAATAQPAPTSSVWTPPPLPVPTQGPASSGSPARKFYLEKVHAALGSCASCHASGAAGAPIFIQADAATAYQTMDGRAYITKNSVLVTKGQHTGPALDANQRTLVDQWLALEATERVGQAAPVNILDKVGQCLSGALFQQIGFEKLLTEPRDGENTDQCTGCNKAMCNTCHTGGDGGFYMGVGSNLDPNTFTKSQAMPFIAKYIGLNGTAAVPSFGIKAKQAVVAIAPAYAAHPKFTIPADMEQRLNVFVQAALNNYAAGLCGK